MEPCPAHIVEVELTRDPETANARLRDRWELLAASLDGHGRAVLLVGRPRTVVPDPTYFGEPSTDTMP